MPKQNETIYGLHAVKTLLQTRPQDVLQLFIQQDRQDHRMREITTLTEAFGVRTEILSRAQFEKRLGQVNHQGVAAVCHAMCALTESDLLKQIEDTKSILLLVLDGVQDPHNLGACLRSANAMGVHAVITPKDRAASVTEVVKKVACGAAEHTPIIAVTNLNRFLEQIKEAGVWLVGLAAEGSQTIASVDLKGKIAIVMGNEGDGLRRLTKEACDYLVNIPMCGVVESLNVSVATGIALYEVMRQRA